MAKPPGKTDPKKIAASKHKADGNVKYALHKLNMYKALIQQDTETTKEMVAVIEADLSKIKKIADTVSVADYLMNLNKALTKIGEGAVKAMEASGKAVRDAHKDIMDGAADIAKDHVLDDIKEFGDKHQEDDDVIIGTLSRTIVILDQWTSPTWWFYALLRKYEGASWSNTLFKSIGGELEDKVKELKADSAKRIQIYHACQTKSQKAMEHWVKVRFALNKKMAA